MKTFSTKYLIRITVFFGLFIIMFLGSQATSGQSKVYYSEGNNGDIRTINQDGSGGVSVLSPPAGKYLGVFTIDKTNNKLYNVDDDNKVRWSALEGGVNNDLSFTPDGAMFELKYHKDYLYYSRTTGGNGLRKYDLVGSSGPVEFVTVSGSNYITAFDIDEENDRIYYFETETYSVKSCDLDGNNIQALFSLNGLINCLIYYDGHIYYSYKNGFGTEDLRRCETDNSNSISLAVGNYLNFDIDPFEEKLYAYGSDPDTYDDYFHKMDLDGENFEALPSFWCMDLEFYSNPELVASGNGATIRNGETQTSVADDTEFGDAIQTTGTVTHTFTLTNSTTNSCTVSSISSSGSSFATTGAVPSTISANSSEEFHIEFDPQSLGLVTETITINYTIASDQSYTFAVSGTGVSPAPEIVVKGNGTVIDDGDASPIADDYTDFGSIAAASGSVVRTFTIQNTGNSVLSLTDVSPYVSITGHTSDFTLTATPSSSISAEGSTTFDITFNPTTKGTRSAIISIANDDSDENPYNFSIQGEGVNSDPTIAINEAPLAYTENDAATQIDAAGTVSDVDGDADWNGGKLEVQITGNPEAGDEITIPDDAGAINTNGTDIRNSTTIIGNLSASEGTVTNGTKLTITFNTNATNALVQQVLRAISYRNTSDDPGTSNRTITFTATDKNSGSASDTRTVSVTAVNDEPTLTATGADPTFTEGGSAASLFNSASASTVEGGQTLSAFTLTVTDVTDGSNERLSVDGTAIDLINGASGTTATNSLSYSVSVSETTATVSCSGGTVSAADFQTLVDALSYQNNSNAPNTSNRVVTITSLTDDGGTDNSGDDTADLTIESTVTVVGVNDEPTLTATGADPTFLEEGSAVTLFSSASASTVESGQNLTEFTLTVDNVSDGASEILNLDDKDIELTDGGSGSTVTNSLNYSVSVSSGTATLTFTSGGISTATLQSIVNNITYQNTRNNPNTSDRVVTITSLKDNGGTDNSGDDTATLTVASTVTVTAVNDTPSFTIGANQTVAQNAGAQTINGFATDIDDGEGGTQTVSFNVSNNNNTLFTSQPDISSSGVLTYTPDATTFGKAVVTVSIKDNGGTDPDIGDVNQSADQTFTIFVTPTDIYINELNSDPSAEEFVELYNARGSSIALDGLVLVFFNGAASNDATYKTAVDLDGNSVAAGDYFVIGDDGIANQDLGWNAEDIQNGPDAVGLFVGDQSDFPDGTAATSDGLVDAIVYGSSDDEVLRATLGGVSLFDENANGNSSEESLSRWPDGTGSFVAQGPTPGVTNDRTPPSGYSVAIDQSPIFSENDDAVSFTFAGAEVGATYNYTFTSDGGGTSVTGSGTTVTATDQVTSIDLSGLTDGTITLSVTLTDVNGNTGIPATDTETKDVTAPSGYSVSIDQNPIHADNENAVGFTFAGAEVGASYSYTFSCDGGGSDVIGSGTIATSTDQITGIDLSGLNEGTITLSVSLTDTNGNVGEPVTDTDIGGIIVTETDGSSTVAESGIDDSFTVALGAQPTSTVTLKISSGDANEVVVDRSSLTFGTGNWNVAQTVTLTPVDDNVIDGTQIVTITISVDEAGSDAAFVGVQPKAVSVSSTDDDEAGFILSKSIASVAESGTEDIFTVKLSAEPSSNVVLDLNSADEGEVSVSPASLTFTSGDWNTEQTVTLTGVDDALVDGPQTSTITVSVNAGSSDDDFDGLINKTVLCTTTDNDVAGFSLTESDGTTVVSESGTTDDFTIVLDAQPVNNVLLNISSNDVGEASVNPTSLTFTNGDWNSPQTITVTGIDDALMDGSQTSTITVSVDASSDAAFKDLDDETLEATTKDDDTPGITITESDGSTTVDESGTNDTFSVVLNSGPASNVVLDVLNSNPSEARLDKTELTFTSGNWNVVQNVTLTGEDDVTVDGDRNYTITIRVNDGSSDDAYDSLADETINATTTDDDVAAFTVSKTNALVTEPGGEDVFTVVLDKQPLSDVVFNVSSGDEGEVLVDQATLTFTNANWNSEQTVKLTGEDDVLVDGNQSTIVTIAVDASQSDNAFDALESKSVDVTTTDDDVAGFTLSKSNASVDESGTSDSFTVVLNKQPLSDVTLKISSGDTGEAIVDLSALTFTNSNWNTPQTITLTGIDDDLVDGDQDTDITISVNDAESDNAFDSLADQFIKVSTKDDDKAGIAIVETDGTTSVTESGSTDSFSVVLDGQPLSDVVINISSGDPGEATVDVTSLTFTNANWSTPQNVTVTGADDVQADGDQSTQVTIAVDVLGSDDAFDGLQDKNVSVMTSDNEEVGFVVTESDGGSLVDESGSTDSFSIVLKAQPLSDVVFTINSGDTGEATVNSSTLTFTSGNWNSAQTITITGVDEELVDGDQTTTITIGVDAAESDDVFDEVPDQNITCTTTDDDVAAYTVSKTIAEVAESGSTATFTVVLDKQPLSDVIFNLSNGDTGEVLVDQGAVTFTNANWNSAQIVKLTGVDDDLIDGNQSTTITLSVDVAQSDDAFDALSDKTIEVTTSDDDEAGFTLSKTVASVAESGTKDSFTVALTAEPVDDVVLQITTGDTGEVITQQNSLTFTSSNWDVQQTVDLVGVDDHLIDGTQTSEITLQVNVLKSDKDFDSVENQIISVTTDDDDEAGFSITESDGATEVSESGGSDSFTLVLDAQPASDVVLNISSGDPGEVKLDQSKLTFSNTNWNTPQTLTITGVEDAIVDGTQNAVITVSLDIDNSDDDFDSVVAQTLPVANLDNDEASYTLSKTSASVSESGSTDVFTVVLDRQAAGDVVFVVENGDVGEISIDPLQLSFTSTNWDTPQSITITCVDDHLLDGNQTTAVRVGVDAAKSMDAFDGLPGKSVEVTTIDDDEAGFTIVESGGQTSVTESGSTDSFTVVLNAQPVSDVVLGVKSGDIGEVSIDHPELIFTTDNWGVPQTVTVTGMDDETTDDMQVSLVTIGVDPDRSDDDFDSIGEKTINVRTVDDDLAGFSIAQSDGNTSVTEAGAEDSFSVVLDAQPQTDVVINVVCNDTDEATVDPAVLTFTNGNWNTPQAVMVKGVDDYLVDGDQTVTITMNIDASASDDHFDALADRSINVTNSDDDVAGFLITETDGNTSVVESGDTDSFSVVLTAQPESPVVLKLDTDATDDVIVEPTSLEFTRSNWNVEQTVTVTGKDNKEPDGDRTIDLNISVDGSISDETFNSVEKKTLRPTVINDDSREIAVQYAGSMIDNGSSEISEELGTNFGGVDAYNGIAFKTFQIDNTGNIDLKVSSISIVNFKTDFSISDIELPLVIPPGGSSYFEVKFDPASVGISRSFIEINSNDLDDPEFKFLVRGWGTALSDTDIRLYPNPNNGEFWVEVEEQFKLHVFDDQGGLVEERELPELTKVKIVLNELPNGMYLLQFTNSRRNITKRVLVQHK